MRFGIVSHPVAGLKAGAGADIDRATSAAVVGSLGAVGEARGGAGGVGVGGGVDGRSAGRVEGAGERFAPESQVGAAVVQLDGTVALPAEKIRGTAGRPADRGVAL